MRALDTFPHRAEKRFVGLIRIRKKPVVGRAISARQNHQRDGVLREAPEEGHERRPTHAYLH
jgi:hypothetical protein